MYVFRDDVLIWDNQLVLFPWGKTILPFEMGQSSREAVAPVGWVRTILQIPELGIFMRCGVISESSETTSERN